ncbi:MAG: DUF1700 domain-containing protein [Lachnospira sp.]|nr:DUF1700 domain-containing protein [Lachnospira sp.]
MTKTEYLKALQRNLKNVPSDEVYNIMEFYREYFEEAGEENEAKVMEELGSPESLAIKASANYVIQDMEERDQTESSKKKPFSNLWVIVLAICGSPVWFPLVIAGAAVLFAVIVTIGAVLFAFGVSSAAATIGGVVMVLFGIATLVVNVPTGLFAIGSGLLGAGVGIFLCIAAVYVFKGCRKLILAIAKKRINKKKMAA